MKTKFPVLLILFVVFSIDISFAKTDSTKPIPIDGGISRYLLNYDSLSNYYFNLEKGFINYKNPFVLHSVSYVERNTLDSVPKYFRLNYDYLLFLNTNNISFGINGFENNTVAVSYHRVL